MKGLSLAPHPPPILKITSGVHLAKNCNGAALTPFITRLSLNLPPVASGMLPSLGFFSFSGLSLS